MGTRTYSRRRADGTRVLTRMGRERSKTGVGVVQQSVRNLPKEINYGP